MVIHVMHFNWRKHFFELQRRRYNLLHKWKSIIYTRFPTSFSILHSFALSNVKTVVLIICYKPLKNQFDQIVLCGPWIYCHLLNIECSLWICSWDRNPCSFQMKQFDHWTWIGESSLSIKIAKSLKLQNKSIMKKTVTIKYKIFKIQAFIDVNVLFLKTLFCFLPMRFRQMFFQLCLDEESLFTEITFIRLSIEIHVMF